MTRTTGSRALVAASAALLLALGLAGCTGGDAPVDTATPTTPAAPSPEPTTEAPTEEPAVGATCDDVLTPEAYAQLEADGLEPRDPNMPDPIAQQIADDGGIACLWVKPQTDNELRVAHTTVEDEAEWTAALTAAGYVQTDDPVAGAWTGPVEAGSGIIPVVVLADGTITFVSAPIFAQWIRPVI